MKAKQLISALVIKLATTSQKDLASALGISVQTLSNWKKQNKDLTARQVAAALAKSQTAAVKASQLQTIKPIVEFYIIDRCESPGGKTWQLFSTSKDATEYARGLRKVLEQCKGIYIFYDSRGRALYAGKTQGQTLWKELNLAFNRDRKIQKINLVGHPDRNQAFTPGHEKLRQPASRKLELFDLAGYFSAYQVTDGMIGDLEALLVRAFSNDLLNKKMERFVSNRDKES